MLDPRDIEHIEERLDAALDAKTAILRFSSKKQKDDYFTVSYAHDVPKLLDEIKRLKEFEVRTIQGAKK
jgi:hypothetical protein